MTTERLRKLRAYCDNHINLVSVANHKWLALEPMGTDRELLDRINESLGAHSFNLILHTLLFDLVKDLAALTRDADGRSPSIVVVTSMLRDADLVAALRADLVKPMSLAVTWAGGADKETHAQVLAEIDKREARERLDRFDRDFPQWLSDCARLLESELVGRFWDLRRKTIAHYSMIERENNRRIMNIADIGLKWGEPLDLLRQLEELAHRMLLLVSGTHYDIEDWRRIHAAYAQDLWLRITGRGKYEGNIF
jgi:hypothetical protein